LRAGSDGRDLIRARFAALSKEANLGARLFLFRTQLQSEAVSIKSSINYFRGRRPVAVASSIDRWWQNWPKTHAYVASTAFFPTSVDEIVEAVQAVEAAQQPVRAVGGGWSFTDAPLPGSVATNRPDFNGADAMAKLLPLAEGFPPDGQSSIASLQGGNAGLIGYDKNNNRVVGGAAPNVAPLEALLAGPQPQPVAIINTSSLKSMLPLFDILSKEAAETLAPNTDTHYFHVEAGIRMDDLQTLLDMQSPRLQLGATGGNPGATLAGTISTATHGAEFNQALLIDRVRAIHFVGPGGQQWWIEGEKPVASTRKLRAKFPGIQVISGSRVVDGLSAQDWLNAVVVSMGSLGVIYSVVIEVPTLQGFEQVTNQTTWSNLLGQVGAALAPPQTADGVKTILRNPSDPQFGSANTLIAKAVTGQSPFVGMFNGGIIGAAENFYADLAFNPNPTVTRNRDAPPDDRDIWIVNRRDQPLPFDQQPPQAAGFSDYVNAIVNNLKAAFGGDVAALVARLAEVYAVVDPLHIDIPLPHADIAALHVDIADTININPHVDVTETINDTPHIDTPGAHVDVGQHFDLGAHVDISVAFAHGDIGPHLDIAPHVDVSPHVDVAQHIDVAPHVDVAQHVDVAPHIDVTTPHIDLSPGAINIELSGLLLSLINPLLTILNALFGWFQDAADVLSAIVLLPFDLITLVQIIQRITGASDTMDVALGEITGPIAQNRAFDIAQPMLTGLLAAVLGTATSNPGISVGTDVGAIGFPDSGLVGTGLEIAMPVETAFGFLQSQILDAMRDAAAPLFGYVSVRLCPQTTTLMGMQQWPLSVMIEVVGFGDAFGKQFIAQLQQKTLNFVASGGDAMLHWGLENDQVSSAVLNKTPALLRRTQSNPALNQIGAFRQVRASIKSNLGANPANLFPAFDNAFTARMGL
jgi:hypothetical protein